jgi:DNA-binding FadR family transcriptional regulator
MPVETHAAVRKRLRFSEPFSVLAQIHALLEDGGDASGVKLPPEGVLAAQLKVGRSAFRRAVKALGVLDIWGNWCGDGSYLLRSLIALCVGRPAVVQFSENAPNMLDPLAIYESLQPEVAAATAMRSPGHELLEIAELKPVLDNDSIEWKRAGRLDFALHAASFGSSGNAILNGVHRNAIPFLFLMMKGRDTTSPASPSGRGCAPLIRPSWKPSAAASRPRRNKSCSSICTMPCFS